MNWTSPNDIKGKLLKLWEQGRFFVAEAAIPAEATESVDVASPAEAAILGEAAVPAASADAELGSEAAEAGEYRFPLRGPSAAELLRDYEQARAWVQGWQDYAEKHQLRLDWQESAHRQLGRNSLPRAVIFSDADEVARYLSRQHDLRTWRELSQRLCQRFPALRLWTQKRPFELLSIQERLDALMDLSDWYLAHRDSALYLRQVSVPGIDTKCVEQHKGLLRQWWDILVEAEGSSLVGPVSFERRYGFREKPELIRFRVLDSHYAISGYSDLSVPAEEFAAVPLAIKTVLIVENDICALSLPPLKDSMVIFGRGYGFEALAKARWLQERQLWYWGDIDTNGFAILDQLRSAFPASRSFLMDADTFLANKEKWVSEPKQCRRELSRLSAEEYSLYQGLLDGTWGLSPRLEQELLPWQQVLGGLRIKYES